MIVYALTASLTWSTIAWVFVQDTTTPNTDLSAWSFILLAALLWPITLPSILKSQWRLATRSLGESI